MSRQFHLTVSRAMIAAAIAMLGLAPFAAANDWDNGSGDAEWSNPVNWSGNIEPNSGTSAIFPAGFPGPGGATTVKLGIGEQAFLVGFGDNYSLANPFSFWDTSTLTLASGVINASAGKSANIYVRVDNSNGLTKNGAGSVSLWRTNTIEGTVAVDAGTLGIRANTTSCNYGLIANAAGSTGVVTVDGAGAFTPVWSISGTLFAGGLVFGDGAGTLNILGGGRVECIYTLLGGSSGSSSTINISGMGSALTTNDDLEMPYSAGTTTVVNITGGTVTCHGISGGQGDSTVILDGGTLDTQGFSIGGVTRGQYQITNLSFRSGTLKNVSQINGGAGLTKTTAGTLTLEGANTYTGDTTVSEGTLKLSGDGSFASSPIIALDDGTTLDVADVTSGANFNGTSFALASGQTLTGSGTVIGAMGVGAGSSITVGPSESLTLADDAQIDAGSVDVAGGSLSAPNIIDNGTLTISAGTIDTGVLSAGNDGTLTGGAGTGSIFLSGGSVSADAVLLGSTTGGSGDMTVSGSGDLTTTRLAGNDFIVNGGTVTVLDEPVDPPDPVLDRSMVAGYVRDGALSVNAGMVTTPNIKLGVTAGKTGTYTQGGGTVNAGVFGLGNDGTLGGGAGVGSATINGGTLEAGSLLVGSSAGGIGTFKWRSATPSAQTLDMVGAATLAVELAGLTPGIDYGELQIGGNATLTGTLDISLTDEFYPPLGQSFVIMTFGSRSGTFDTVTGTDAGPGRVFRVDYNPTDVTLVVVPLPGDMNCDETFDELDVEPFVLALTDFGAYEQQYSTCDALAGDFNADSELNGMDIDAFVDCLVNGGCE